MEKHEGNRRGYLLTQSNAPPYPFVLLLSLDKN